MPAAERFEEVVDPVDRTRWRVDVGFFGSGWRCRCWRRPLKVESEDGASVLRRWRRSDEGDGGETMASWCTEADECFDAHTPVAESMAEELRALVGPEVAVEIRRRVSGR